MGFIKTIADIIRSTVYPSSCAVCDRFENNSVICRDCAIKLKHCAHRSFINLYHANIAFTGYALYKYCYPEVRKIVIDMKRHNNDKLFDFCANNIAELIKDTLRNYTDYTIVHIPTRKPAVAERGFDQARILSEKLSKNLNIPYLPLLLRNGKSREQKNLNSAQRQDNVRGVFSINPRCQIPHNVILIDDVCTTGSTANECIRVLKSAGCRNIACYFVSAVT